jgi:hypothetical protein
MLTLVRRRLFNKLLYVATSSAYITLSSVLTNKVRWATQCKKGQFFFRHKVYSAYNALRISNNFLLIIAPQALFFAKLFKLTVWFLFIKRVPRLLFTNIFFMFKS